MLKSSKRSMAIAATVILGSVFSVAAQGPVHTDGPTWPTFLTFADKYVKLKN